MVWILVRAKDPRARGSSTSIVVISFRDCSAYSRALSAPSSKMIVSGAIAGLGGAIETLGITYRYAPAFNLGLGFDGITIALLGRVHPIGIIPGAILIGGMRAGAANMQFDAGVAPEIVDLLMALILLFVTAPLITRFFKNSSNKSMTSGWGN